MALRDNGDERRLSGWHVLTILLTAFAIMLLANGAMIYIATDRESDFRALIDALC
jgi:nitrogen fixation protein FixH